MKNRMKWSSLFALLVVALGSLLYFALGGKLPLGGGAPVGRVAEPGSYYYCPMHKDYHSDKPGNCPICSMKLVKHEPGPATVAAPDAAPAVENAIFVSPERQQLIGMRSVPARMESLVK